MMNLYQLLQQFYSAGHSRVCNPEALQAYLKAIREAQ